MTDLISVYYRLVKMVGSMKLLQFAQKFHQNVFGIYRRQSNQKQCSISPAKTIILISFAQYMFTTAAFFLVEAKSMFDYGLVFYLLISIINCIAIYLIFIWQSKTLLSLLKIVKALLEGVSRLF